jgi:pyruvate,water dikinase
MGFNLEKWTPAQSGDLEPVIHGVGTSPGQVVAPASVLSGPEDFGRMSQGKILVTAITTPAWTPLFALAEGVVTDVGGPLSHSSIVAREYGIPAVLGTGIATKRIQTGQTIAVDGSLGIVSLVAGQLGKTH